MKKGDSIILLIVVVVAIGLLLFNGYRNSIDDPITVEVRVNGEVVDSFSIDDNIEKVYESEFGMNKISIADHVVSVVDADCHDQICVNTKHGTQNGDAIVCVPNRFTVELIGTEDGGGIDAIAR